MKPQKLSNIIILSLIMAVTGCRGDEEQEPLVHSCTPVLDPTYTCDSLTQVLMDSVTDVWFDWQIFVEHTYYHELTKERIEKNIVEGNSYYHTLWEVLQDESVLNNFNWANSKSLVSCAARHKWKNNIGPEVFTCLVDEYGYGSKSFLRAIQEFYPTGTTLVGIPSKPGFSADGKLAIVLVHFFSLETKENLHLDRFVVFKRNRQNDWSFHYEVEAEYSLKE